MLPKHSGAESGVTFSNQEAEITTPIKYKDFRSRMRLVFRKHQDWEYNRTPLGNTIEALFTWIIQNSLYKFPPILSHDDIVKYLKARNIFPDQFMNKTPDQDNFKTVLLLSLIHI